MEGLPFPPPELLGWSSWAPWSSCSQSCLAVGGGPGWRSRSRFCPSSGNTSCPGEPTQEEACSPPVCPGMSPAVPGVAGAPGWDEEQRGRMTLAQVLNTWGVGGTGTRADLLSRSASSAPGL